MEFYAKTEAAARHRPMRVIVLGLPRTGTTTMCAALKILGIRCYHWDEMLKHKINSHLKLWLAAIRAKFEGQGVPFRGGDFDTMLWDYDAVSDAPCCFFIEELVEAYPRAKVILNTRTRESWLRSMQKSVLEVMSWKSWRLLAVFDEFTADWYDLLTTTTALLSRGVPAHKSYAEESLLQSFDAHYRRVKDAVPTEKLLEYNPSQGWEPLCEFLECSVPEVPFPHLNGPEALVTVRKAMYWERLALVIKRWALATALLVVVLALLWG